MSYGGDTSRHPGEAAIRVAGVSKSYGATPVLRSVSLSVEQASCTAVLGPSGCGKTTLLRIVAGLARADGGTVEIAGAVTDDPRPRVPPERRGVGLVFQDLALWPHMTVAQNLAFVLEARRVPASKQEELSRSAAAEAGFPSVLLGRRPGELSGGERQRAAIARVLVQAPRVLLLDEPLSSMDRGLRVQLLELLRRLIADRGLACLLVTHDREEAFALARRVVVLRGGQVTQEGTPEEVYARPASRWVAELVGTATCLPAERRDGRVVTPLGEFEVAGAPAGPFLAVFRPEAVRFAGTGRAARLVDSFYRGDHWMHSVALDGDAGVPRVLLRTPGTRPPAVRPGDAVHVEADAPALVPAEGASEVR